MSVTHHVEICPNRENGCYTGWIDTRFEEGPHKGLWGNMVRCQMCNGAGIGREWWERDGKVFREISYAETDEIPLDKVVQIVQLRTINKNLT